MLGQQAEFEGSMTEAEASWLEPPSTFCRIPAMWKPATRQITGTNDGVLHQNILYFNAQKKILVP